MRDILEMCVELDTLAAETYHSLASACDDPGLAALFDQLAREEEAHVGWWTELLESWESGLIPDIVTDPDHIVATLHQVREDITSVVPEEVSSLTPSEMLELAIHLEFFMLEPVFAELIELTEPGRTGHHREAYSRHVERLVGALEEEYGSGPATRFLARVLKRALRDNSILATSATRDPLTGLFNRRGALSHLTRWISWAHRYERPILVLLIDIDSFKAVNDTYGHATGDTVLGSIAAALVTSTRESDYVARYGGDEFAIVAPETHIDEYHALVDRILSSVRDIGCVSDAGKPIPLSVSIGGAVLTPGAGSPRDTIDVLLAAADSSMYEAKAAGRDRAGKPVAVTPGPQAPE